jgi:S-layer protein (TIGR01567 family)
MNKCIKYVSILIMLMAFAATAMPASAATPPDPTGLTGTPGNSWVNHTWDADTTGVTDSYNLSVNGAPHSTTNEYWNGSYSTHAWQNITVQAFNDSDGLSTGSVSQKTQILNNPITITGISDAAVNVGATVHVDCNADDDDGDAPTFSCNRTDLFSFNTATGVGDWATTTSETYYVDFGVSDGYGSTNNVTMKITVSDAATTIPPKPTNLDQTTGKYWVNHTWERGGVGTDGYNVSWNGEWDNGTETFFEKSVDPGEWVNISVWAYNQTGDGNRSDECLNGTAHAPAAPSGYETGYRVWDEDEKMASTYTWTAKSFTGFYYDLDEGKSTENLTIEGIGLNGHTIEEGNITYETTAIDVDFEYNDWGSYKVIGFMAEKYFAGYEKGNASEDITKEDIKLVSKDMLSKVLIDEEEDHTIATGASLNLKEGYELKILQLDINGDLAQLELLKDGKQVDTDFMESGETYVYKEDLGKLDNVPLIIVHIGSVFAGTETNMLEIDGIFQISDDYESVKDGTDYDEMEIKSTTGFTITMKNSDDITLEEGELVDLMGNIKFLVADDEDGDLRFALYEEITEPGTYDIRGTVHDDDDDNPTSEWNHLNFEGFYYDIDTNHGTETLTIEAISSDGTIEEGKLVYRTEPQLVEFDYDDWGSYQLIGFMAEIYFAGYEKDAADDITKDDISLISKDMLSKVLLDVGDDRTLSTGASLELVEGYELKILQLDINGELAQLELLKDGKRVDTDFVDAGETYVYKKDLGKLDDVPIIAIHIGSVFAGTETNMVEIDGFFQISDDYETIDDDDNYGEMEIRSSSKSGITMDNSDSVTLEEDETIMIMGNVGFEVSDDGDRYYPFVRRTVGSIAALKIELPESLVVDEEIVITITADGDPVEGVQVQFAGENLDLTDSDGKVRFTSEEAGTFTIVASKENYDSASVEMQILTEAEADRDPLEIEMPDKVEPGEDVVIKVMYGGDAIENASITWDGDYIGDTDETGSLTYTAEDEGIYTVIASKEGYLDGSEEIEVAFPSAEFELADLTFPAEVSANKKFTVSVDVTNTGDDIGTYLAELKVNDSVVDSQNVTLDAGDTEKIEFTTKIAEAGTTTIEIGTESGEITVTEAKSNTALVAAVLIVLALLGAIGYVLISSAPEGGWTVEKLSDAIKDKFQRGKGL